MHPHRVGAVQVESEAEQVEVGIPGEAWRGVFEPEQSEEGIHTEEGVPRESAQNGNHSSNMERRTPMQEKDGRRYGRLVPYRKLNQLS